MKNLELLFKQNKIKPYKINLQKDGIHVQVTAENNGIFSGVEIERLIATISLLPTTYVKMHLPIHLYIKLDRFIDKLTVG